MADYAALLAQLAQQMPQLQQLFGGLMGGGGGAGGAMPEIEPGTGAAAGPAAPPRPQMAGLPDEQSKFDKTMEDIQKYSGLAQAGMGTMQSMRGPAPAAGMLPGPRPVGGLSPSVQTKPSIGAIPDAGGLKKQANMRELLMLLSKLR